MRHHTLKLWYSWTSVIRPPVIRIYLYYPAVILQCILCIFHSFPHQIFLKTKTKWINICLISFNMHFFFFFFICYKCITVAMSKCIVTWINPRLSLLCLLGITPISRQITYPDRWWSRRGWITEVGLYIVQIDFSNPRGRSLPKRGWSTPPPPPRTRD